MTLPACAAAGHQRRRLVSNGGPACISCEAPWTPCSTDLRPSLPPCSAIACSASSTPPRATPCWPGCRLRRFAARETVANADAVGQRLGIVARGSLGFRNEAGERGAARRKSPDWFGAGVQPAAALAGWTAVAETAALVGFLPADELDRPDRSPPGAATLRGAHRRRSARSAEAGDPHMNLMKTPVRKLLKRAPVTVSPHSPIRAVAELMRDQRVSSVLLVEQGHLFGLVTDRDLRNRALAAGLDPALPVRGDRHRGAADHRHRRAGLRGAAADGAPQHPPRAGDGRQQRWPA